MDTGNGVVCALGGLKDAATENIDYMSVAADKSHFEMSYECVSV